MSKTFALAIATATLAASPAFAQSAFDYQRSPGPSAHVGVSGGQSKFRTDCASFFECDQKDTGWKVYGGSTVSDVLGWEVGYTDFGAIRASGGEVKAWAGNLSLVGGIPIGPRFTLFGKVGGVYGSTDVRASTTALVENGDRSGWGWTYGVGGALGLTRNVQLRVDWDRYKLDFAGGSRDVDLLSAGVQLKF
jgi:OmpA-OmpF porin, OOP family